MTNKPKICIVGWHYFNRFYNQMRKSPLEIYIVAHRHNKILDDMKFKYSVTKNVGLERGAYDWYLKNRWNKKSSVLFIHDDVVMKNIITISKIAYSCRNLDQAYIIGTSDINSKKTGERCLFMSAKFIRLLLKNFGGIWYDKYNRGYIWGDQSIYDKRFDAKWKIYRNTGKERNLKLAISYLNKKYSLKSKNIFCKGLNFYRRGYIKEIYSKMSRSKKNILDDYSIFSMENNILEKIATKTNSEKQRDNRFYTKWYDFYFSRLRLENLNILEIGITDGASLQMWKSYFSNSTIYGMDKNKSNSYSSLSKTFKIFIGNTLDKDFLNASCLQIPFGPDIIIDNGMHKPEEQKFAFQYLFDQLSPGGIYVIEEIHTSYIDKSKDSTNNIMTYLKNIIDDINLHGRYKINNFEKILCQDHMKLSKYERCIATIHFYPGICFIFKRHCK